MSSVSLVILIRTAWLSDDAFITLRTIDNWVNGYGLTWNPIERVQTYSHPLWMFLLSLFYVFIRHEYFIPIFLSLLISIITIYIFLTRASKDLFVVVIGWYILMLSKSFVDFSSSGLENPATHLILLLFVLTYLKLDKNAISDNRRIFSLAFLSGLGMLNRVDLGLFFIPPIIYMLIRHWNLKKIKPLLLGLLPIILWELFSVYYYGFLFPNTAYAKLNVGIPRSDLVSQGGMYFLNSFLWDPITLIAIIVSLLTAFAHKNWKIMFLTFGVALYLTYILVIGGDFMSGRFFSGALLVSILILLNFLEGTSQQHRIILSSLFLFIGLISPRSIVTEFIGRENIMYDDATGITDERVYYASATGLSTLDRRLDLPRGPWVDEGKSYRLTKPTVVEVGAVGMVGYYAGPDVYIYDRIALGDPLLGRLPIRNKSWRIGHFKRPDVDGHFETLETQNNQIADQDLATYYDKLLIITRGDLMSFERLKEIWKMNTGKYDYLINNYLQRKWGWENGKPKNP